MSLHKNPKYQIPELIAALKEHRLDVDTPSQLSDAFRIGWLAGREAKSPDADRFDQSAQVSRHHVSYPVRVEPYVFQYDEELFIGFDPTDGGSSTVGAWRTQEEAHDAVNACVDQTITPPKVDEMQRSFNAAIDFAIQQGPSAAVFLESWREGDTSEWPEFTAKPGDAT